MKFIAIVIIVVATVMSLSADKTFNDSKFSGALGRLAAELTSTVFRAR